MGGQEIVRRSQNWWVHGALAAAVAMTPGCHRRTAESETAAQETQKPVAVQTVKAALRDEQEFNEFVGTVRSRTRVQLSARVVAHVLEIPVASGDRVKKDALLVRLDDQELQTHVKQAESALTAADAQLREARQDHERYQKLFETGAVTKQLFDQAEARLKTSQAAVDQAAERIREAKINLRYAELRAPFDAVVVERQAEAGDLAAPGRSLVTIESPTDLRLEAPVSEMCVRRIRTGSDVRVSIEAADAVLGARVTEIVPAVDPSSRSFLVRADLPVLEGVQPGMFGRFQFACEMRKTLAVPPGAVQERGQLDIVFVVDKERARLRIVRPGRRHTSAVEILSGLTAGETLVANPPESLQDGDPILPAPASPARTETVKP